MVCPHCGAENPDYVLYCGSCGEQIRQSGEPSSTSGTEDAPANTEPAPPPTAPDPEKALDLPASKLTMAAVAAAVGVVLLVIGLVLYAYYIEHVLSPNRNYEDMNEMFDIAKYSFYARMVGEVSALIGAVLVIQAVMVGGFASASAAMRQIRLDRILWIGIVMIALMTIVTFTTMYLNEASPDLGEDVVKVISRVVTYSSMAVLIFGALALLMLTVALRSASLAGREDLFSNPPKTR